MSWDDSDPVYRFVHPRWEQPFFYFRVFICRLRGHRWGLKMHGRVCDRCRLWEPR